MDFTFSFSLDLAKLWHGVDREDSGLWKHASVLRVLGHCSGLACPLTFHEQLSSGCWDVF